MKWAEGIRVGKASHKAVLISLCWSHHDTTGRCNPSVATMASFTELNRKTVLASLKWLEESELIAPEKRYGTSTNYRLNMDATGPKNGTASRRDTSANFGTGRAGGARASSTKKGTAPVPNLGPVPKTVPVPNTTTDQYQTRPEPVPNLGHNREIGNDKEKNPPIVPPCETGEPATGELIPASELVDPFDEFWQAYPRKTGKADARKAFAKCREPVGNLIADIRQRLASGHWSTSPDRKRFIMHPATYLRGERWTDEIVPGDAPMDSQSLIERTNAQIERIDASDPDDPFSVEPLPANVQRLERRQ